MKNCINECAHCNKLYINLCKLSNKSDSPTKNMMRSTLLNVCNICQLSMVLYHADRKKNNFFNNFSKCAKLKPTGTQRINCPEILEWVQNYLSV